MKRSNITNHSILATHPLHDEPQRPKIIFRESYDTERRQKRHPITTPKHHILRTLPDNNGVVYSRTYANVPVTGACTCGFTDNPCWILKSGVNPARNTAAQGSFRRPPYLPKTAHEATYIAPGKATSTAVDRGAARGISTKHCLQPGLSESNLPSRADQIGEKHKHDPGT